MCEAGDRGDKKYGHRMVMKMQIFDCNVIIVHVVPSLSLIPSWLLKLPPVGIQSHKNCSAA